MYHIKNDKRAEKSVELICNAVSELIKEKAFDDITVTDVQRVSTVSRSTFYRNFDSLTDVLALMCDSGFNEVLSDYLSSPEETRGGIGSAVFNYWFSRSAVLEVLVDIHRADILYGSLRRCALGLGSHEFIEGDDRKYDYLISMIASVMMGVMVTWIEHGKSETREQALASVKEAFAMAAALGITS